MIAGCDFSTRFVDIVLLDEDSDAATWHRFELHSGRGVGAFDRTRGVRDAMPGRDSTFWDDVMGIGVEDPRGYGAGALYRIQGAILACLPTNRLVHPHIPSAWRKTCGLPGNAPKLEIAKFVDARRGLISRDRPQQVVNHWWPQDACDAYCIALATRSLLQHGERAA